MPHVFRHQLAVPEEAIDDNGHVNNVAYVQWMQDVAILHSDAVGLSGGEYRDLGTAWVVRSHHVEYLRPAFKGELLEASTWIADLQLATSLRKYEFVRQSDQVLLVRAQTEWAYVRRKSGRLCRVHPEVAAAFEVMGE